MAYGRGFRGSPVFLFLLVFFLLHTDKNRPFGIYSDLCEVSELFRVFGPLTQMSKHHQESVSMVGNWRHVGKPQNPSTVPVLKELILNYTRKRFLQRRFKYSANSSTSFNPAILMLTRSGVNLLNPGPQPGSTLERVRNYHESQEDSSSSNTSQ